MKKISILVDHNSWVLVYAKVLFYKLKNLNYEVRFYRNKKKIQKGDVLFILGCKNFVDNNSLSKNKYNLVVHESKLPKGKGLSPVSNQILKKNLKLSLQCSNASNKLDSGPIVLQDKFIILKEMIITMTGDLNKA